MIKKILPVLIFLLICGLFINGESDSDDTPPEISKESVSSWLKDHFKNYFQKYYLSCEAAVVRLTCASLGIREITEDEILEIFPYHDTDPGKGLVIDEINGRPYFPDGSINWANYGAHAPVLEKVINTILRDHGKSSYFTLEIVRLTNNELKELLKSDEDCLGVIIWVAAPIRGKKPPVNGRGQVLGEHVQFVDPALDMAGRLVIYDVWPWPNQPFRIHNPYNRDMFNYESLVIRRKVGRE